MGKTLTFWMPLLFRLLKFTATDLVTSLANRDLFFCQRAVLIPQSFHHRLRYVYPRCPFPCSYTYLPLTYLVDLRSRLVREYQSFHH